MAKAEAVKARNPWAERINRHPADTLLRCRGFRIHSRPRLGVALWQRRDGVVLSQEQALEEVKRLGDKSE